MQSLSHCWGPPGEAVHVAQSQEEIWEVQYEHQAGLYTGPASLTATGRRTSVDVGQSGASPQGLTGLLCSSCQLLVCSWVWLLFLFPLHPTCSRASAEDLSWVLCQLMLSRESKIPKLMWQRMRAEIETGEKEKDQPWGAEGRVLPWVGTSRTPSAPSPYGELCHAQADTE